MKLTKLDRQLIAACVVFAVLALVPLVVQQPYWISVLMVGMFVGTMAQAWNLLAGFTGLFSLAPAAFCMLGAYTSALMLIYLGVPAVVALGGAIGAAGATGWILGWMTLRMRGPYLALTTLAFGEVLRQVVSNSYNVTRGDLGLPVPTLFGGDRTVFYYLFLALLFTTTAGLWLLLRSRVGLFLQAIRDDQVAAAGRGIDVVRWKVVAMALSSAVTGLAGALYVHFIQLASPELGIILQTALIIVSTVVGGMGTLVGPVIGALVVQVASEALRAVGIRYMLVFALVVIVLGRFLRTGLWGALGSGPMRAILGQKRGVRSRAAAAG